MTHSASRATTGTATGTTFTFALIGMAVRGVSKIRTALKNRRQIAQLHQLDDRALKDIGLLRTDVHAALAEPLYRDPSQHLVDVAGINRSGSKPASGLQTRDLNRLRHPDAAVKNVISGGAACA
ncbi:MAG: DUF1127 domain-containing protein [Beijerinckiaceae bacterium]